MNLCSWIFLRLTDKFLISKENQPAETDAQKFEEADTNKNDSMKFFLITKSKGNKPALKSIEVTHTLLTIVFISIKANNPIHLATLWFGLGKSKTGSRVGRTGRKTAGERKNLVHNAKDASRGRARRSEAFFDQFENQSKFSLYLERQQLKLEVEKIVQQRAHHRYGHKWRMSVFVLFICFFLKWNFMCNKSFCILFVLSAPSQVYLKLEYLLPCFFQLIGI